MMLLSGIGGYCRDTFLFDSEVHEDEDSNIIALFEYFTQDLIRALVNKLKRIIH